MSDEKTVLSVVVPIYRVEKYLKKCIEALLSDIPSSVEIILVDDGSDDGCPEICEEYAKKHKEIRVIHKKNGGLSSAVREGVLTSRGEYIGFCDGDDYVADGYAREILKVVREHSPDVIYFDYNTLKNGELEKKASGRVDISDSFYKMEQCKSIKDLYMRRNGLSPCRWNKAIKREYAFMTLQYYDTGARIGEDILFTAPVIYRMRSFYYIKKPLINYNVNDGSMTLNFNKRYLDNFYLVFDCLKEMFEEDRAFLGYINYINMRTFVNSVSKSHTEGKARYLSLVFRNEEFKSRIEWTDKKQLSLPDKIILSCMKKGWAYPLILISLVYRASKWLR